MEQKMMHNLCVMPRGIDDLHEENLGELVTFLNPPLALPQMDR